jgi:DinB superfamily
MKIARSQHAPAQLISHLQEARARLLDLVADLDDEQMTGERLAVVNPLRWEIAHVAFFQEFWLLRHLRGFDATKPAPHLDPDKFYDSARVAHDTRWDLPLPSMRETIAYMRRILDRGRQRVRRSSNGRQCVGMDGDRFRPLPGLCRRPLQRILRALVRRS